MPEEVTPPTRPTPIAPLRPRRALFWGLLLVFFVWMGGLGIMWYTTVHHAAPLPPVRDFQREMTLHLDPDSIPQLPPPRTRPSGDAVPPFAPPFAPPSVPPTTTP